jgi:alcohol dehydrogenase class IV
MAIEAIRSISPNLRAAYRGSQNRVAREALMIGATQAGIAFSNASVALVHGMSRPIGAHFHVPHGLSNAMLLPTITAFSAQHALSRYADCARAMRLAKESQEDEVAADLLIHELHALNEELDVPTPARYGIIRSEWERLLPTMAEQALASGSPASNPRIPTLDEIKSLYLQVYD